MIKYFCPPSPVRHYRISVALLIALAFGTGLPLSTHAAGNYIISKDGKEVMDNNTGLIWRRCIEGTVWNGSTCIYDSPGPSGYPSHLAFFFNDALPWAAAEASLTGQNWRIPNIKELLTLMDRTRGDIAIDTQLFPVPHWLPNGGMDTRFILYEGSSPFWSSTISVVNINPSPYISGYHVFFSGGGFVQGFVPITPGAANAFLGFLRLVRDPQ